MQSSFLSINLNIQRLVALLEMSVEGLFLPIYDVVVTRGEAGKMDLFLIFEADEDEELWNMKESTDVLKEATWSRKFRFCQKLAILVLNAHEKGIPLLNLGYQTIYLTANGDPLLYPFPIDLTQVPKPEEE